MLFLVLFISIFFHILNLYFQFTFSFLSFSNFIVYIIYCFTFVILVLKRFIQLVANATF